MSKEPRYLVAGCTPWAERVFRRCLRHLPGRWGYVATVAALSQAVVEEPLETAFFLHWRWRVSPMILDRVCCIGFHLGDFATYRGGTPLQHQILAGETGSRLTMFRLMDELDAGPAYTCVLVTLDGTAEAIYARVMEAAARLIEGFVREPWAPGGPSVLGPSLPRRRPDESALPEDGLTLPQVYDRIRMVDAEGYPYAFFERGGLRYTVRRAALYDGRIEADVTITEAGSGT